MRQKFRRLTFVLVTPHKPKAQPFVAIINGSYAQIHGATSISDFLMYAVYKIDGNRVSGYSAWYTEDEIEAMFCQPHLDAEQLIEDYIIRRITKNRSNKK